MKFKRYIAKDMNEACNIIRDDLGSDAVIVSSKKVKRKGIFGFFLPRLIEVTAAIDNKEAEKKVDKPIKTPKKHNEDDSVLAKEMHEVKELLKQVIANERDDVPQKELNPQNELKNILKDLDLLPEVEQKILDTFSEDELKKCCSRVDVKEILEEKLINFFIPVNKFGFSSNVLAFIGPTGVGKTTTLAKLAANFALYHDLKIALITIDTYRIGAVAQLKTYGEIIGVSVEAVMTPLELKAAVKKYEDCDLILIDTAGRSSKNTEQIVELKSFIEPLRPLEIYLVLDANTKNRDLLAIAEKYNLLKYSKLVLTKLDETYSLGSLLNVVHATNVPIAYVTNGQNVPDDIIPGEPERLAKLIVEEVE